MARVQRHALTLVVMPMFALLLAVACGGGDGLTGAPSKDGEYAVKPGSLSYDGDRYRVLWADSTGEFTELSGSGLKMVQGDRTFLEKGKDGVVLHLTDQEPVQVLGRDREGNYSSPWFPFIAGAVVGNALSGPRYHYPPTATFGRGDQLNGSVVTTKASPPKYEGLPANPNAVSGQNQGTGGGNAATNKAGGGAVSGQSSGSTGVSGQSGGTGTGSAASDKGGFRSGSSSFDTRTGRSGGSGVSSGSGSGGGSKAAPNNSKPKAPSGGSRGGGSRGGGGRSGGK